MWWSRKVRKGLGASVGGVLFCLVAGAFLTPLRAEVVRVVVDRREALLDGRPFGEAGAYEKLTGRILFAFDPADPANARVVDLDLAPRNAEGKVEVWAAFVVLQPVEPGRRRGVAWVDIAEGGVGRSLELLGGAAERTADPTEERHVGDGLILDEGVTLVWVGWEAATPAVSGGLSLPVPTAREADGGPVVGWVRVAWQVEEAQEELALASPEQAPYPVAVPDAPVHTLTVRDASTGAPDTIPSDQWEFVVAPDGPAAGLPGGIRLAEGFEAGRLYELVYRAEDPRVTGLGFLVVRDVAAYSRYDLRSEFPTDAAVAFGVDGGARFLRDFVREGFNVDETGRGVFDAVWTHGAGARGYGYNVRFGPSPRGVDHHRALFQPDAVFPFSIQEQADPVTGRTEGLIDRLPSTATPRTIATLTDADYWRHGAALTHTSVDGLRDLDTDSLHRVYALGVGRGHAEGSGEAARALRAVAIAVNAWVADDAAPPPSRVPRIADGTLVPVEAMAPRAGGEIAGRGEGRFHRLDFGERFQSDGITDRQPPGIGPPYPFLVPQVDRVGNPLGGVRPVSARVPLATRRLDAEALALPLDEESARATGDDRPSIEALYGSEAGYLARVRSALEAMIGERFLLERDREAVIAEARDAWQWLISR